MGLGPSEEIPKSPAPSSTSSAPAACSLPSDLSTRGSSPSSSAPSAPTKPSRLRKCASHVPFEKNLTALERVATVYGWLRMKEPPKKIRVKPCFCALRHASWPTLLETSRSSDSAMSSARNSRDSRELARRARRLRARRRRPTRSATAERRGSCARSIDSRSAPSSSVLASWSAARRAAEHSWRMTTLPKEAAITSLFSCTLCEVQSPP
mmetsp:Transcript_33279/g.82734  ORF Transcript_33279/g.82734 Transcript_33279/m.82734 type:complete len:209 (+) Transcript_33279:46-672(+)